MAFVDVGKSRLYYESHGEGQPILFAHGVGGNHASWFNQVPTFARRYRCIVFDHRGFGNSTDVEGSGRTVFVDDAVRLLDALGIERTILVGQSMGGGTCLSLACTHPGRVQALALCDTLVAMQLPESIRDYMAGVETATRELSQAERVLGPQTRTADPERTLLYLQIASFNTYRLRTLPGSMKPRTPEELAQTGIPTTFIVGSDDVLFPPKAVKTVHEHVPGSQYIEIPGAGHSAYFEQHRAFNDYLLEFLAQLGL
jgi:pimeloyl-ACP methyl ester carboxylesterase